MSMCIWRPAGLVLAILTATLASAPARSVEISTDGGLAIKSDDGDYSLELGGRVMWDADSFDGVLNRGSGGDRRFNSDLRRARLEMSGNLGRDFEYVFDTNFVDGEAEFQEVGLRYTGLAAANLFVGRIKEPFGLEELASSNAITTIERNYFTEATDVDSQPHFGVQADGFAGPVGWVFGIFNPAGNPRNEDGGDRLAFTGRLFGAPLQRDDRVLHIGAAYTDRNLDAPTLANAFRLDVAEAGGELDSSAILIDEDRQLGLEALFLDGPFSLQAEAFLRDMPGAAGAPDGEVRAAYIQAAWTLTGESRGYKAAAGVPGMIQPNGRRGAVELVAKADFMTFEVDDRADEEEVAGYLVGANWYPNQYVKLMLNVIWLDSDNVASPGAADDSTVVSARVQFAF